MAALAGWRYEVNRARGVVHVFYEASAPLSTVALREKLLEVRRSTGVTGLCWDAEGRAEIERSSGADFDTWWSLVSPQLWKSSRIIPSARVDANGRAVHVSAHTSFGVGMTPPSVHF